MGTNALGDHMSKETSDTMDNKDILGGGSTNNDPFLSTDDPGGSTDDPGGGKPPVRSTSNTMDNKDNLDGGSTNDDPGFRGNSNTNLQAVRIPMSRVSLLI